VRWVALKRASQPAGASQSVQLEKHSLPDTSLLSSHRHFAPRSASGNRDLPPAFRTQIDPRNRDSSPIRPPARDRVGPAAGHCRPIRLQVSSICPFLDPHSITTSPDYDPTLSNCWVSCRGSVANWEFRIAGVCFSFLCLLF
jgi:hypothetical protein